jgi:DNA primase
MSPHLADQEEVMKKLGEEAFDEMFVSAIAFTWQQHRDSLALRPVLSHIPTVTDTVEQTGAPTDPHFVEEGEHNLESSLVPLEQENTDEQLEQEQDSVTSSQTSDSEDSSTPWEMINAAPLPDPEPFIMNNSSLRRSSRQRKPNPKYANTAKAVAWANSCQDQELAEACTIEAHQVLLPSTLDANSWQPAPRTIRDIMKLPEGYVKAEWMKSVKKELKTLIDSGTFAFDKMNPSETITPMKEIFKVKMMSDGSLDKLKTRMVVRGDLQNGTLAEDKWSPTASF